MFKFNIFLGVAMSLLLSCSGSDDGPEVDLKPQNLSVTINSSAQLPGLVSVTINADNAEYYAVDFDVNQGFEESTDKSFSYQYEESGEYSITARAYGIDDDFIEEINTITVDIPDNGIPSEGYTTPLSYSGYNLVWSDEFDGSSL